MTYADAQLNDDEKRSQKRRLMMEQIAYDSDLKKNQRAQEDAQNTQRAMQCEMEQIRMNLEAHDHTLKKLRDKEAFLTGELRRIKKELINLR